MKSNIRSGYTLLNFSNFIKIIILRQDGQPLLEQGAVTCRTF